MATQLKVRGSGYLPTLDGWRTLAIALVICSHNQIRMTAPWSRFTGFGEQAVDLFFALSGFLICHRLLGEEQQTGAISLRGFYIRRVFRLQPAALTYLLTVALLAAASVVAVHWTEWFAAIFGFYNLLRNPGDYPSWFTGQFWSLSAEEQFYLVLPAFLVLVRRKRLLILSSLTVLLEAWRFYVARTGFLNPEHSYHRSDLVVGCIAIGCVTSLLLRMPKVQDAAKRYLHPWITVSYTIVIMTYFYFRHTNLHHAASVTTYPLLVVSTMLHPRAWLSRLLELPPVRYIGRLSYSIYLWQQMFFRAIFVPPPGVRANGWLCLAAAMGCACLSYHFIEQPLIRIGHRIAMRYTRASSEAQRPEPATAI